MLRIKEGVAVERFTSGDTVEGIVVDTNTGGYLSLNVVALEMFEAIQESPTEEAVAARLMERLDVDQDTLTTDLAAFKSQLIQFGLGMEEAS